MSHAEREAHCKAALEILSAAPGVQGGVVIMLTKDQTPKGYAVKLASDLPAATRAEVVSRVADALRGAASGIILLH